MEMQQTFIYKIPQVLYHTSFGSELIKSYIDKSLIDWMDYLD